VAAVVTSSGISVAAIVISSGIKRGSSRYFWYGTWQQSLFLLVLSLVAVFTSSGIKLGSSLDLFWY